MKLFACICNQPQRLAAALAPVRAALVAHPPISRWGLGYIQGGDVLLVRTPRGSNTPVELAAPVLDLTSSDIKTDCVIAQAVRDDATAETAAVGGTDNTPPFRYRRWLYAQTGWAGTSLDDVAPRLLEHVPDYLRRNIRGRTPAELVFHLFLAMLHDEGNLDDPNLPAPASRRALAATLRLVGAELGKAGKRAPIGTIALTNGRSMVVAHGGEPLRVRRLWVPSERGERDETFRGFVLVSGGDGDGKDGFEDVPAERAVLIARDLQMSFADLNP
jgi:hypothetical protein